MGVGILSLSVLVAAALVLALAAAVFPNSPVKARWKKWREAGRRSLFEDVLKHLLGRQHQGRAASPESLAGALGLSLKKVLGLVVKMESAQLLTSQSGGLHLTKAGERWALQVVRAHRLWETYLADETGMPLGKVHEEAERAEHSLSAEQVEELDAQLGHPRVDPHGDPIPDAAGDVAAVKGVPLTDWPEGRPAQIVHVEDEPASVFRMIPAKALRPGVVVRVVESSAESLKISDGENVYPLAPVVAANVQVAAVAAHPGDEARKGLLRLSELQTGEEAEVALLDPEIRGFSRRRLLDLGVTPGSRIRAHLGNIFGDPRAFRIRGTTVALRREQASGIWVRRCEPARHGGQTAEVSGKLL